MTTSKEMILVGGVVQSLSKNGSWCGETHIQKATYVAKSVASIPFDSEFVLYKYGPYSFDLSKSLSHMRIRNIVAMRQNPGYGSSFDLNEAMWLALNNAADRYFRNYSDKVEFICHKIARKNVAELERLCTAVFLLLNLRDVGDDAERVLKMTELKPHIEPAVAAMAFEEAHQLISQVH